MPNDFDITPSDDWCLNHPIENVSPINIEFLKRRSLSDIIVFLFEYVDLYNCQFRGYYNISSLSGNKSLRIVFENIENIIDTFFSTNERLDKDKITWDWNIKQRTKFLLYLSNSSQLIEIHKMQQKEIKKLAFKWIDTINLLHEPCVFTDTEAITFKNETRFEILADKVHSLINTLYPIHEKYGCDVSWTDWTELEHRDFLLFTANEMLHILTKRDLVWRTFSGFDDSKHTLLKGIFPYYASHHQEIYLIVLRYISNKYQMYQKVILSMVFVLGYLSPYDLKELFRQMSDDGIVPGSCEKDKDELLSTLSNYVLAWFYNDEQAHSYLETFGNWGTEMPRWVEIPKEEKSQMSKMQGLISMYSYYVPDQNAPGSAFGSLFCVGKRGFHKVLCDPSNFQHSDSTISQETVFFAPTGGVTGAQEALLHSMGQMAHGLSHTDGKMDHALVEDFRYYLRVSPQIASYLIDVAKSSTKPLVLLEDLFRIVSVEQISVEHQKNLQHRINFEIVQLTNRQYVIGDLKTPFYIQEIDKERYEDKINPLNRMIANFNTIFPELINRINSMQNQKENYACNATLNPIFNMMQCPDKFLDLSILRDNTSAGKSFWKDIGFSLFIGDLDVTLTLNERQKGALRFLSTGNSITSDIYSAVVGGDKTAAENDLTHIATASILVEGTTNDGSKIYSLKPQYLIESIIKQFIAKPSDGSKFSINDKVDIAVIDPRADSDRSIDYIYVHIMSNTNRKGMYLRLNETGEETGIFTASFGFSTTTISDGVLLANPGDKIIMTYRNQTITIMVY